MNEATPSSAASRSPRRRWLIVASLAAIALLLTAFLLRRTDSTQYLTAKVQRGEIRDTVEATGTVNAVITVQVGSQVSGTIARLDADFNSRVHKGQVVAAIDPKLLQGTVAQAMADLANARANVTVARSNRIKAEVSEVQTKAEFDRAVALVKSGVGTEQALDLAKANYESARASVAAAAANVEEATAQVAQKEAALGVARTNLQYAVIRSPIEGTVVARNVDVGQTVAASLQAPTLFTIAQDLKKMQVYAKVDESDVGRIRMGQPVTFKVDAFPKDRFTGTVTQVRMNPTTVQNVVTYDAIIEFGNPELKLFPGMTAYVTLPVATAEDVIKVPNAALRFKPPLPPEAVRALYAKRGIDAGGADGEKGGMTRPSGGHHGDAAVVWKRRPDGALEPVQIVLGITDHTFTEVAQVLAGALAPGDEVVTSATVARSQPPGAPGIRR